MIPLDATSCQVHGIYRDIVRRIDGNGIAGDWCVLALTQPELDPVRGSLVTDEAFAIGDHVWAAGFAGADARQGPRVLSGRLAGQLTGLGGMMLLDGEQAVALPGMSGAPVVRWMESSGPRVIGVLHGRAEIGTSWAGLFTTTSLASCVVVDKELHVAVAELLRDRQ